MPRSASRRKQMSRYQFVNLPDDVLFLIFSKCDIKSLGRLGRVCRRLRDLINTDSVWLPHSKSITIVQDLYLQQAQKTPLKEKCRISLNWSNKCYRERVLCRYNPKQMPWMDYCEGNLWISTQNTIKSYHVRTDGQIHEDAYRRLTVPNGDVSRFVVRDGWAVGGCRDGSIYVFDQHNGQRLFDFYKVHDRDTQTVDFYDTSILSGARDKTVKILSTSPEDNCNEIRCSLDIGDRIWSLAVAPHGKTFTVGTAGCYGNSSLSVWDLETAAPLGSLGTFRHGAGVLDMKYETETTLLTCGYDSFMRMWDTRINQCVLEWEEPFDTTLYCLQTDRDFTIVTGTARYGMLRLWDKRKTEPTQLLYLGQRNSPVYSVAFDSSRLYAALDLSITMADFSLLPP